MQYRKLKKHTFFSSFDFWSRLYLAIINTDFCSSFFSLLSLVFTHFMDTQEADFLIWLNFEFPLLSHNILVQAACVAVAVGELS